MHTEALAWVREHGTAQPVSVLDLGGRDINGTAAPAFPNAEYVTLDLRGPVDIEADAATWVPTRTFDVVVSTEVFEHCADWPAIIRTAWSALVPGGLFVATMAGPGRPAHSAIDGGWNLHEDEHYANVEPEHLRRVLSDAGFTEVTIDVRTSPADVRCAAIRPS